MKLRRRWVRSWPAILPSEERSYVVDSLPRLQIEHYDLASNPESWTVLRDCTLLEWDIAVSPLDMLAWEAYVNEQPRQVHVAPYRVYAGTGYPVDDWIPRLGEWKGPFGFGMIWFPASMIDRFHAAPHHPHAGWFTDGTFSDWYLRTYGSPVVHWDIRPVHLNYSIELPTDAGC